MALIIKKKYDFNKMDKKTAYTWGGCVLVFLFIIISLFSAMGGDEKNPDKFDGLNSRAYDLAALPFINDAAEKELLAKYTDINGSPVTSTLYTPEEKAARQAEDAAEGAPGAPDEEYEAADKALAARAAAKSSYDSYGSSSYSRQSTPIGSLSSTSMASGSGGSRGSVWSPGNRSASSPGSGTSANAAAMEKLRKSGRGILEAQAMTSSAAKQGGAGALSGAVGAFQGGKSTAELDTDLEKAAAELDIGSGAVTGTNNAPSLGDVKDALDAAKKDAKKDDDKNKGDIGCPWGSQWGCVLADVGKNLANGLVNVGIGWLDNGVSNGFSSCMNNSGSTGYSKADCMAISNGKKTYEADLAKTTQNNMSSMNQYIKNSQQQKALLNQIPDPGYSRPANAKTTFDLKSPTVKKQDVKWD